jgi:hypothetical protein
MSNVYHKAKEIMSKVANDNTIPTSVWFSKFIKVGIVVAILAALFLVFS